MSVWFLLLIVCIAGAVGGIVNALLGDDKGFVLPRLVDGVYRPGWLGNVLTGAIAAGVSWGLYGPLAAVNVFGPATDGSNAQAILTLSSLVGAVLVGVGGSRWLSNEVDKVTLQKAAASAAGKAQNNNVAQQIAQATPAQALRLATAM